jgi:hypothetical protein
MPGWLGGVEVSVPSLLLVGFLQHRDRVLDAWVARALGTLPMTPGVGESVGPVTLDGDAVTRLQPDTLRPACTGSRACLLVVGEPDWAGKVADAIALWASDREPTQRVL